MFDFNFDKINCFFNCKCLDNEKLKLGLLELEKIQETTSPYIYVNMFLGKMIHLTKSKLGFVYKVTQQNSASYKAISVYGLSVNTLFLLIIS